MMNPDLAALIRRNTVAGGFANTVAIAEEAFEMGVKSAGLSAVEREWIPYTGSPPPHWTPEDRYNRRPKRAEDWDYRNDTPETRKDLVERRLNFAGDLADPRVELEMTIVHRIDLMDVMGELTWRRAQVESLRNRLASSPTLHPSDREAIARIIDPNNWNLVDHWRGLVNRPELEARVPVVTAPSLAKADAILALSGSLAPANPTEKGE